MDERHSAGLARALESPYLMNPTHSTFTNGSSRYANPATISPASTATGSSTSSSPHNEDAVPSDSYDRPYSSLERDGFPDRIFQIMRNDESRELMCSFPRGGGYDPKHLSSLAQGVSMTPFGDHGSGEFPKTNCTRRLECSRAIPNPKTGGQRKVDTLYIPHDQVIFACHRVEPEEPKQNQHYQTYASPAYDTYQAGSGAWGSRSQEEVPPTPSSLSSQDQPLPGYTSYPPNSYPRNNSHYSGSWPPSRETPSEWPEQYSASGYGEEQTHSMFHTRTQQTPSLRSTQSSQNLYPRPSYGAQGSYPTYGQSQPANGQSWGAVTGGWDEQSATLLPPREIQQASSSRYYEPYISSQHQVKPDTPTSAQPTQQYFQEGVSTTLRPVRFPPSGPVRQSPPGLKRSADDMLYSGGSASGSGDERSASPPLGNAYGYHNAMGYADGSPPNSYARSLGRESGPQRTNGNPPPGVQKCVSCSIENSPEWRKGENGVKNLCNACGLRYARSKQKREGIIPQRRKKKEKAAISKAKKVLKGKRQGGDSASPPPMMTTPPTEHIQPMELVDSRDYRHLSPGYGGPPPNQYYYDASSLPHHRQYQS